MTHSSNQGDHDEIHRPRSSIVRGSVVVLILAIAVAGIGAYRAGFLATGGTLRAQEPTRESAAFYTVEGSRITVPATSPLRAKLGIAEVAEKSIQRSLTLPAVVEADPARTVKVLPPVIGRVIDLKVQLGRRVAAGDELAVIDSGDLAQAIADDEKARSALKLTKQILDRLLELEKYSAVSVKDRQQAQSDYVQAQAEAERAQSRLRAIGVPADQNPSSRLLSLKAPVAGSIIDLQIAEGALVWTVVDLHAVEGPLQVTAEILTRLLEHLAQQRQRPLQLAVVLEQTEIAVRVAGRRVDGLQGVLTQRHVGAARPLPLLGDGIAQQGIEGASGPDLGQRRANAGAVQFAFQRPLADFLWVGHVGTLVLGFFQPGPPRLDGLLDGLLTLQFGLLDG